MKVLIACEFSGIVRDAFIKKGHNVISCDLLPTESPGPHYQGDVLSLLNHWYGITEFYFDLMIAFPPCTFLCVPGAHYLHKQKGRWDKMLKAKVFFMKFFDAYIEKIAIENPVPHKYAALPKYNQIIHPWQFGQEFSKRTCLWLKGLPELKPSKIMENHGDRYYRKDGSSSNSRWYAKSNAKQRSKTFQGIADAMADQWG